MIRQYVTRPVIYVVVIYKWPVGLFRLDHQRIPDRTPGIVRHEIVVLLFTYFFLTSRIVGLTVFSEHVSNINSLT